MSAQATIRVGFYENPPKLFTDERGQVAGFFPEILQAIADSENWTLEYVPGTWAERLERLESGEIDLMPDVAYSEARASIYGFSEEPLFINWGVIYQRPGAEIESIPDLVGKRIAVMEGSIHTEGEQGIVAMLAEFDIESEFIEFTDYLGIFEALEEGEADAGAVNRLFGLLHEEEYKVVKTAIVFNPRELRFAYPLGSAFSAQLAERIDEHVRAMKAEPDSAYYRSLSTYLLHEVPSEVHRTPHWLPWVLAGAGAVIAFAVLAILLLRYRQTRLRETLAASEVRFETMFANAGVGIAVVDLKNRALLRVNPRLCEMLGYREQEILNLTLDDILHSEDVTERSPEVRDLAEGRTDHVQTEERLLRKDGSRLWGAVTRSMVEGARCVSSYGLAVVQDIAERKRAEASLQESEEKFRSLFESMREGVALREVIFDNDGNPEDYRVLDLNPAYEELTGISREEAIGKRALEIYEGREPPYLETYRELVASGEEATHFERRFPAMDKTFSISFVLLDEDQFVTVLTDVTDLKKAEEETRRYQSIVNSSRDLMTLIDADYRYIAVSNSFCAVHGRQRDEIIGRTVAEIWGEVAFAEAIREDLGKCLAGEESEFSGWMDVPEEGRRYYDVRYTPFRTDSEEKPFAVAVSRDITERIVALRALEASEETARALLNATSDSALLIDPRGVIIDANEGMASRLGSMREALIGTVIYDHLPPELAEGRKARGMEAARLGTVVRFEDTREGRWLENTVYPVLGPDGEVSRFAIFSRDITELKRVEAELRRHRDELEVLVARRTAELRAAVDAADAAMFRHDLATDYVALDDRWYEMAGVDKEEFPDTHTAWEACLHPEDRDRVTTEIDRQLDSDATGMQIEYRLVRPNGEVRHIESRSIILRDALGCATGTVGLNIDVTQRVRVEQELREREAFMQTTLDNLPAHFWATDVALRFTVQNELCRRAMGDVVGKRLEDLEIPNDLREPWMRDNERVLAGETVEQEFTFPLNGGERDFVARISPILLDGEVVGTIGTSIDITERKNVEQALRESEAYLRTLMGSMPIDFFALDRDMRYTMQSTLSQAVIGNAIGQSVADSDAPEELKAKWMEEHRQVLDGETIHRECRLPIEGDEHTFITTVAPVRVGPDVVGTIGTSMDITERKRMEEELRRAHDELEQRVGERTRELRDSEERFRRLFERAPDAFYITDLDGVFVDGNRAAEVMVGVSKGKLIGHSFFDLGFLSPEDRNRARGLLAMNAQGRPTGPDEFILRQPTGGEVPVEIMTYPLPMEGRTVVLSVARDVTERRRMIEELRASKELAEGMIDTANAIIVELDAAGKIVRFNRYAEQLTGYSRSDVLEHDWFATFVPVKDREALPEVFAEVLRRMPEASSNVNPIVCKDGQERIIEWRNTTINEEGGTASGVLAIGIDITERENALRDLRASEEQLLEVLEGTITAFAQTVEARDPYTAGHQQHVTELATAIARRLELREDRIEATRVAGLLHDIGKIAIPAEILAKPTELTPVEWELLRQHPANAFAILERIRFPWPIAEIVRQHHERMDGTGYPSGLKGEGILLEARILAVADTVEAMASHRPYRPARGLKAALEAIREGRGTAYDPRVVDACVELFEKDEFAFEPA